MSKWQMFQLIALPPLLLGTGAVPVYLFWTILSSPQCTAEVYITNKVIVAAGLLISFLAGLLLQHFYFIEVPKLMKLRKLK